MGWEGMQQPKKQCTRAHMDPSLVSQLGFSVCASFILLANFPLRTRLLATSASCSLRVCMLSHVPLFKEKAKQLLLQLQFENFEEAF